jgi:hypothetical protein
VDVWLHLGDEGEPSRRRSVRVGAALTIVVLGGWLVALVLASTSASSTGGVALISLTMIALGLVVAVWIAVFGVLALRRGLVDHGLANNLRRRSVGERSP